MAREEARQILEDYVKACREDDFFKLETGFTYEQVIEAMDMGAKSLLSHSLPSDLDEAAGKYANREFPDEPSCGQWGMGDYEPPVDMEYPREIAKDAFKVGAEWMAEQGYITECTVDRTPLNGPTGICTNLHDSTGFKLGDRVIVQIRKK